MTDPTPAPAPSRWTPEVVIGLLCLVASAILPHLDLVGVGTALALVSAWLLGPLPSPLTQRPPGAPPQDRGHARAELVVGLVAVGLALAGALALAALSGGCGSQYVARDRAIVDWWPGPPCHLEVRLDDPASDPVVTVDAPSACEPAPQQTPAPDPEPQS